MLVGTWQGLIGLLVKLSSGSFVAFRSLYELNISNILKDVLSTYDLSHGISPPDLVDGNCNQVCILEWTTSLNGVPFWLILAWAFISESTLVVNNSNYCGDVHQDHLL